MSMSLIRRRSQFYSGNGHDGPEKNGADRGYETKPFDGNMMALTSLQKSIVEMVQQTPNSCLAGGAALAIWTQRYDQIKDWDIYVADLLAYTSIRDKLTSLGFRQHRNTIDQQVENWTWEQGYSREDVQVIKDVDSRVAYREETFQFAQDVLENFDLTCCCVAMARKDWIIHYQARYDIQMRQIRIHHLQNWASLKKRVAKYQKKGYEPIPDFWEEAKKQKSYIDDHDDIPF